MIEDEYTKANMFWLGQLAERHRIKRQIDQLRNKRGCSNREIVRNILFAFNNERTDFDTFMNDIWGAP